jgi:hypothetical protein
MTFIQAAVNRRDFRHPATALRMLQTHDTVWRPVKVISDKGYLLVKRFEGIA